MADNKIVGIGPYQYVHILDVVGLRAKQFNNLRFFASRYDVSV